MTMTANEERVKWEEAAFVRENGTLERPVKDLWQVPPGIELVGDRLVWPRRRRVDEETFVRSGPGLLDGFMKLGDAPAEQILAFARRWGVLGICVHGAPASHRPPSVPFDPAVPSCMPQQLENGDYYESLISWRYFASATQALVNIAARLQNGGVGASADWRTVYQGSPPLPGDSRDFWDESRRHREVDVLTLCERVNDWLQMGNVSPALSAFMWLSKGTPELQLGSPCYYGALFGAIALQLALVIGRSDGLATCDACGNVYIPSRRPNPNRRSFCSKCGLKAAWRFAARDHRRREPTTPSQPEAA